jgi:uncharacterized protein YgiM (DUF1202 family)
MRPDSSTCTGRRIALAALAACLLALMLGCQAQVHTRPAPHAPPPEPTPPVWTETVTAYQLNVRNGPGPNFQVINTLHRGEVVEILGREGNWIQIRNERTPFGWVYGAYLSGFPDIPRPTSHTPEEGEAAPTP